MPVLKILVKIHKIENKFLGDTAFHIAARRQNKEMIELLAKNNSDFMRKNKK